MSDPFQDPAQVAEWARKHAAREPGLRPVNDAVLDAAAVGPEVRVLDLAAGTGALACAAAARGAHVTGIDTSQAMLDLAPDCGATFQIGDMATPPTGPWDAIVCRFGAHHAPDGWIAACADVLATGGRMAIAEWSPDAKRFAKGDHGAHMHTRSGDDWARLLEAAGLTTTAQTVPLEDGDVFVVSGQRMSQ